MNQAKIDSGDFCLACRITCIPCNGNRCRCGMDKNQIKENNAKLQSEDKEAIQENVIRPTQEFVAPSIKAFQKQLDEERRGSLY